MVMVPPLVIVVPEPRSSPAVALMVAVPSLMSVPPDTVVVDAVPVLHVAPLATVTVPGPSKLPPLVVSEPVIVREPVPVTAPDTWRGTARLWAVLTPRVPWSSRVPVPVTDDPGLRFRVAADRSSVPEASWIDPVLLNTRLPYRVAVPVEPGLDTSVPALSKVL